MQSMTRRLKGLAGEEGSVMLEFVLMAMCFLTILFGLLDFGRALYTYNYVSYAARDAARFAIVRGKSCTSFATD